MAVDGRKIRDQKFPFLFSYFKGGDPKARKRFIVPINPETYRTTHTGKASVVHTKGGAFVDAFGAGLSAVTMQGTFGYLGSLKGGPGRHYEKKELDAWAILKEFEAEIFFQFYKDFGTDNNPTQDQKSSVMLINLADEQMYTVLIKPFVVTRSVQRPFLYQYNLEMTVLIDHLREKPEDRIDSPLLFMQDVQPPDAVGFKKWTDILKGYTTLYAKVSDVTNKMQAMQRDVETVANAIRGFRSGLSSFIDARFELVESCIRSIDSIMESVETLSDLPQEYTDHMRHTKEVFLQSKLNKDLFHLSDSSDIPEAVIAVATGYEILTAALPVTETSLSLVSAGENPETTLFSPSLAGAKVVAASGTGLTDSDTIESVASRTLGDASQWRTIAFLNDLEPPFIAKTPEQGFSPETAKGVLVSVDGRNLTVTGIAPTAGQILLLVNGSTWESATVESYSATGVVTITAPLEKDFPAGTAITVHDRALSVLRPGDTIKVPGTASSSVIPVTGGYTDHYDTIFGADEYLDNEGLQESDLAGGIEVVVGVQNLEMQLTHRLSTTRGELAELGHPEYGSLIPTYIGHLNEDYVIEAIRLEAKASVLEDPRIRAVDTVTATVEGTAIYIEASVRVYGVDGNRTVNILL